MKLLTLATLSVALGFSQSTDCDTLDKCQDAIKTNNRKSQADFRLGDIYLSQGKYQEAGNELRLSLHGKPVQDGLRYGRTSNLAKSTILPVSAHVR